MALNSIKELRIWCQKVLPLVYDDSLSYYEVLTKVINKLNEVIDLADEQNETIEEALTDIETFETDMSTEFETYKATLEAALDTFESEITTQQTTFQGQITQAFADFLEDYEREFGITNLYGDSTTLAISQNQVSKLLDYTTNNNRFNPEVITSGKAIDNTGALINDANTAVTGYIEVQPGENIVAQAKNNTTNERYQGAGTGTDVPLVFDSIAGYDEELTFVSGSFKSLVFNYQVPVGVKYIKIAMGQSILDGTNTDMSELAIVNSDGTIYPYQPFSEQNATVKMNALPVDDTTVGNHLWSANKINAFQAAIEDEFDNLETDLTGTVQGAIGNMNTAFTQKSAELDTKFDTLEGNIQDQQDAFETEIEGALASQKTELETEIGEVASDVQSLSGSVTTQGQAITNLTGIVTSIDGRVDTLETDMAAAKSDISDLEASDAQQGTDITNLKSRMTAAEGDIDTLETASEEHGTAISNLQAKDAELVSDINGLTTRVGSAEGDIDLLEGRADALETDVDNLETDVTDLEENKADKVGYEKDLNVGAADMLIGNGTISDDEAYNFRRTGESRYVGNRETDEIIGGTLVVNQHINNYEAEGSDTSSAAYQNIKTFSSVDDQFPVGHVIMGIATMKSSGGTFVLAYSDTNLTHGGRAESNSTSYTTLAFIYKVDGTYSGQRLRVFAYSANETVSRKNVMLIDLTQMFGSSTIADYVNTLEQTTAGAGIAWLYKYFPILNGGYIPYNTGTLQSIVLSKHKLTGFNQWDEEWEQGDIDQTTGQNSATTLYWRCKDYIRIIPNTQYCYTNLRFNNTFRIFWYDVNKKFISYTSTSLIFDSNNVFTTPANAYYMRFRYSNTHTDADLICINFSDDRNGEYEPYNAHEYALDSSKELRGIPQIDSNGKLYFNGDRYKDGVTRYFALVDLGSLVWTYNEGVNTFRSLSITNAKAHSYNVLENLICTAGYIPCGRMTTETPDLSITLNSSSHTQNSLFIKDTRYGTDAEAFKAAMSGVMMVYEVATTTTEEATPVPNPQICSPDGTEEYIDPRVEAGTIPFAIPTGHETVYNTSLDYKLNQIPNLPTAAGVYKLQVTVSSGVPSYSWVAEE